METGWVQKDSRQDYRINIEEVGDYVTTPDLFASSTETN